MGGVRAGKPFQEAVPKGSTLAEKRGSFHPRNRLVLWSASFGRLRTAKTIKTMSVQEVENAVVRLSKEELDDFSRWFQEYIADEWDLQIEADIRAGRFDAAGERARADYAAGRCTPL